MKVLRYCNLLIEFVFILYVKTAYYLVKIMRITDAKKLASCPFLLAYKNEVHVFNVFFFLTPFFSLIQRKRKCSIRKKNRFVL